MIMFILVYLLSAILVASALATLIEWGIGKIEKRSEARKIRRLVQCYAENEEWLGSWGV